MKKKNIASDGYENMPASKSAKKRECQKLQKLGEDLAKLSATHRDKLELSQELRDAFMLFDKISDREGKRRQMQFIGKLLREEEEYSIQKICLALAGTKNAHYEEVATFQIAEKFRTKLLECKENEIINVLKELYAKGSGTKNVEKIVPPLEEIEEMVQKARKSGSSADAGGNGKNYSRQLFKEIIEILK